MSLLFICKKGKENGNHYEEDVGDCSLREQSTTQHRSGQIRRKLNQEFGFKQPIVIDKDGVIVAGHTRWLASRTLGLEEVPCIMADDLTDEQIKAYRLADNKVAEFAGWDYDALLEELGDLSLDMTEFGFVADNIDWADVEDIDEENYEEPPKKELRCPSCGHIDSAERFVKVT